MHQKYSALERLGQWDKDERNFIVYYVIDLQVTVIRSSEQINH